MKTTMLTQPIANPRRTRIASLVQADEPASETLAGTGAADTEESAATPWPEEQSARPVELPRQTANPRRTMLDRLPNR